LKYIPSFLPLILAGFFVLVGLNPAIAAFTSRPTEPRCASCVLVQKIQELDCNVIATVPQYGGCEGFCKNFLGAWGAPGAIANCVKNCNDKVAQCNVGGGGDADKPNCKWYSKDDIKKYICRIY